MNLTFNPSSLILALSIYAASIKGSSSSSRNIGDYYARKEEGGEPIADSPHSYQVDATGKKTTAQRRAEKIFPVNIGSNNDNPDVGVLTLQGDKIRRLQSSVYCNKNNRRRFLQAANTSSTNVDYATCGTMCKPNVCECIENIWCDCGEDCASEINNVCNGVTDANGNEWTMEGCITDYPQYPGYQEYFINVFCPFAKCIVDGGTFGSCWCQGYKTHCEKFGDERLYVDYRSFCEVDKCCEAQVDEAGRKTCFEFMDGEESASPSMNTTVSEVDDGSGGSPDAAQVAPAVDETNETPTNHAADRHRPIPFDFAGPTSSFAVAAAVAVVAGL